MGGCGNILSPIIPKAKRFSKNRHLVNLSSPGIASHMINCKIKIKKGNGKGVFATIVEKRGSRLLVKSVSGNKFYKIQEGDYEILPTRAKIESSIVLQKVMNNEVQDFVLDDEVIQRLYCSVDAENSGEDSKATTSLGKISSPLDDSVVHLLCEHPEKEEFFLIGKGRLGFSMHSFIYIIWKPGVLRKHIVEKFNSEHMLDPCAETEGSTLTWKDKEKSLRMQLKFNDGKKLSHWVRLFNQCGLHISS